MRRLVAISEKSKAIAIFAATAFLLTSIHLAAKAHIASLQREQEQLERSAIKQLSGISKDGQFAAGQPVMQMPLAAGQKLTAAKSNLVESSVTAATDHSTSPAPRRQIIISIADRQLAVIDHGQVLKTYPIAVGARGTPSPNGDFVIINHAKDPIYRGGDTEIPPGKTIHLVRAGWD